MFICLIHMKRQLKSESDMEKPVVMKVNATELHNRGYRFYKAENGVRLTTDISSNDVKELATIDNS